MDRALSWFFRVWVTLAVAINLCVLPSWPLRAAEKNTQIIADAVYLKPQRLVEVEPGRRLNVYCSGHGSPTVIFDSGLGDSTRAWALVQPRIAAVTRACSYDRAGLGFSDPSPQPGTSANDVADLHRLLSALRIKPPYVLVGHSMSGLAVKLYADTHLADVVGLVLVDPTHEDQFTRNVQVAPGRFAGRAGYLAELEACLDAKPSDLVEGSDLYKRCVSGDPEPRFSEALNAVELEHDKRRATMSAWISENENVYSVSSDEVRAARRNLGDIPLIVLVREPSPRQGNETQEERDALNKVRADLSAETAALSTRGTVRIVHNSDHYIQLDQPEEVTAAILEVVRSASSKR
jgi:pimeloyl-ACP methyl ester carboxylesterase